MAYEEQTGWCDECLCRRAIKRKGINHILHLLLTLCTAGIWAIIWIMTPMMRQPWICSVCGSDRVLSGERGIRKGEAYYEQHGYPG